MSSRPSASRVPVVGPEMVLRFGQILTGLAAVVARRFLRDPRFAALIVPLWRWLNRSIRRFERAGNRPAAVRAQAPRKATCLVLAPRPRLPSQKAWLVRALGWEAAGYGSQLEALLAEPEMQALLGSVPAVGRILRPLCRMLGVTALEGTPAAAKPRVRVHRKVARKVAEKVRSHSPVSNWMHRPRKKPA